jgi:hypothetical protein
MRTTLIFALILQCSIQCPLYAQSKNQLSIQTGLFHRFLDGGPIMNIGKYQTLYSNIFLESYGLQYQRKLNQTQFLAVNLSGYANGSFWEADDASNIIRSNRSYIALSGTLSNSKALSEKIDLLYGAGIDFRVIYSFQDTISLNSSLPIKYYYEGTQFQIGAHGQVGFSYTPVKWLTLYSQFNAEGYLFSKNAGISLYTQFLNDFTYTKSYNFPSRVNLSLRFGVGINF